MSPLHDYNLANQTPASYRTDHNNLNLAIAGLNASSSGITTTYANMLYADVSSSGWIRQRNTADSTFNYIYKTDAAGGICTYPGNPSTNHIGRFVGQWVYDTSNNIYYFNTLAGTSSQATWSAIASSSAYAASGFPDGYMDGPPVKYNSVTQVIIPGGFKCRDQGNAADISFSTAYTIDITVSGAGGLSTDLTEASSTFYYLYAIRKSGDGTINGILTTATSAPTLPSGYDQYRMLPLAVRNSTAGDFLNFEVGPGWPERPWIYYNIGFGAYGASAGPTNVLDGGTASTYAAVSLTQYVPVSISTAVSLKVGSYASGTHTVSIKETGISYSKDFATGVSSQVIDLFFETRHSTAGSIDYKNNGSSPAVDITVHGYLVGNST
jgi:hypothetical protein